jgi:hypothetical protein
MNEPKMEEREVVHQLVDGVSNAIAAHAVSANEPALFKFAQLAGERARI